MKLLKLSWISSVMKEIAVNNIIFPGETVFNEDQ